MGKNRLDNKFLLFFIALGVAAGLFVGIKEGIIVEHNKVNFLVLGVDTRQGWKARSDSINLFTVDFSRSRVGILSIPRDTLVEIPGHGKDKINHAHMFGGPELTCAAVSKFLGIRVNYYIEVNFPMFVNLVNEVGGITLDVEKPLRYDDSAAGLHINLAPGVQTLDGYKAMGYVRFRHDNASDWGRIERQQKFFEALGRQMISPANIVKLPLLLTTASSNIRTNLPGIVSMKLAMRLPAIFNHGTVIKGVIPGSDARLPYGYYMMVDEEGKKKVIDRVMFGRE